MVSERKKIANGDVDFGPYTRLAAVKAQSVFVPARVIRNGPDSPFTSWRQPGAILQWLRKRGFEVEVFLNWCRARPIKGLYEAKQAPYAPEPGYWLYYRGAPPSAKARRRVAR